MTTRQQCCEGIHEGLAPTQFPSSAPVRGFSCFTESQRRADDRGPAAQEAPDARGHEGAPRA